jgi:hypothetical protein
MGVTIVFFFCKRFIEPYETRESQFVHSCYTGSKVGRSLQQKARVIKYNLSVVSKFLYGNTIL